jgi:hypothetical protein
MTFFGLYFNVIIKSFINRYWDIQFITCHFIWRSEIPNFICQYLTHKCWKPFKCCRRTSKRILHLNLSN